MLICTLNQVLHSAVIPPVHSCLRRQFFTKNTATLKDNYLIWLILTAENSPKFWNTVSVCAPSLALLERSSDQYLGQYELRGWSQWPKLFQCFLLAHTFVFSSLSWNQMTNPVTVLVTVIVKLLATDEQQNYLTPVDTFRISFVLSAASWHVSRQLIAISKS